MSGIPVSDVPWPRPVSAKARLRPKAQLTLPEEIRRALRVNEGDEVEFRVEPNGTITVRGYISVPTDHAWLYAPHQGVWRTPGERADDRQSATHESADAMFAHLDSLGETDA